MPNFTTADLTTHFAGMSATDYSNAVTYVNTYGFDSYLTSTFSVPSFWQTAFAGAKVQHKNMLGYNLNCTAISLAEPDCEGVDVTALVQDDNGGIPGKIWVEIGADCHKTATGYRTSFWIKFYNK